MGFTLTPLRGSLPIRYSPIRKLQTVFVQAAICGGIVRFLQVLPDAERFVSGHAFRHADDFSNNRGLQPLRYSVQRLSLVGTEEVPWYVPSRV